MLFWSNLKSFDASEPHLRRVSSALSLASSYRWSSKFSNSSLSTPCTFVVSKSFAWSSDKHCCLIFSAWKQNWFFISLIFALIASRSDLSWLDSSIYSLKSLSSRNCFWKSSKKLALGYWLFSAFSLSSRLLLERNWKGDIYGVSSRNMALMKAVSLLTCTPGDKSLLELLFSMPEMLLGNGCYSLSKF